MIFRIFVWIFIMLWEEERKRKKKEKLFDIMFVFKFYIKNNRIKMKMLNKTGLNSIFPIPIIQQETKELVFSVNNNRRKS